MQYSDLRSGRQHRATETGSKSTKANGAHDTMQPASSVRCSLPAACGAESLQGATQISQGNSTLE
jgi:hypothetical protein